MVARVQPLENLKDLGEINVLRSNKELKLAKNRDYCLIIGNGPSAKKYLKGLARDKFDIIGFSYLALTNTRPNFYFFEPLTIQNNNYLEWKGYLNRQIALHMLRGMQIKELKKRKFEQTQLLVNPQFCFDNYGFWEQGSNLKLCLPKYNIVNEETGFSILSGMRQQVMGEHHLLNLRGSLIRAVSLAFYLQYEEIWIVGNDPSISNYWYTDKEALEDIICCENKELATKLIRFVDENTKQGDYCTGESENYFESSTELMFLYIKAMIMKFRNKDGSYPKIRHASLNDNIIESSIYTHKLHEFIDKPIEMYCEQRQNNHG